MSPEQRKLITKNQEILYTFRKRGANLPKNQLSFLLEKMNKTFPTVKKIINELKENNIILDSKKFLVNPDFAYFVGFYVTDDEVEVELLDFELESVLDKVLPYFTNKVHYKSSFDIWGLMQNMLDKISEQVNITAISIIFDKFMSYAKNTQENLAYFESESGLKLYDLSVLFKNSRGLMPITFRSAVLGDSVLAYTLYLREKVFESDSIVYYDLDQNRISYVKNNILNKDSNPVFGMVFPRFSNKQNDLFQKLSVVSDNEYKDMIIDNKEEILSAISPACIQIDSFFNPEHFIISGKWIKKEQFENFLFFYNRFYNDYEKLLNRVLVEKSSLHPRVMNRTEQPQKGAGIYAAYSFFNWDLRW